MSSPAQRHSNDRLIDRILNGDTQIVTDDDGIDYEPDGYSQAEIDRRGDEAADLDYDRRMR